MEHKAQRHEALADVLYLEVRQDAQGEAYDGNVGQGDDDHCQHIRTHHAELLKVGDDQGEALCCDGERPKEVAVAQEIEDDAVTEPQGPRWWGVRAAIISTSRIVHYPLGPVSAPTASGARAPLLNAGHEDGLGETPARAERVLYFRPAWCA